MNPAAIPALIIVCTIIIVLVAYVVREYVRDIQSHIGYWQDVAEQNAAELTKLRNAYADYTLDSQVRIGALHDEVERLRGLLDGDFACAVAECPYTGAELSAVTVGEVSE